MRPPRSAFAAECGSVRPPRSAAAARVRRGVVLLPRSASAAPPANTAPCQGRSRLQAARDHWDARCSNVGRIEGEIGHALAFQVGLRCSNVWMDEPLQPSTISASSLARKREVPARRIAGCTRATYGCGSDVCPLPMWLHVSKQTNILWHDVGLEGGCRPGSRWGLLELSLKHRPRVGAAHIMVQLTTNICQRYRVQRAGWLCFQICAMEP